MRSNLNVTHWTVKLRWCEMLNEKICKQVLPAVPFKDTVRLVGGLLPLSCFPTISCHFLHELHPLWIPKKVPFFPSLLRPHCGSALCQRQASSSPQEMSWSLLERASCLSPFLFAPCSPEAFPNLASSGVFRKEIISSSSHKAVPGKNIFLLSLLMHVLLTKFMINHELK